MILMEKVVGKMALPKARILNKAMYNMMKLAGLQANPPVVVHPTVDGFINQDQGLQEGQIITFTKAIDPTIATPKELVTVLNVTGDLSSTLELYSQHRSQLISLLPFRVRYL